MTPKFPREFQPPVLKARILADCLRSRGYHPLWHVFPDNFSFSDSALWTRLITLHLPLRGFSLNSAVFNRLYSRHLLRFLFLPLLRCFNPGRSQSLTGSTNRLGVPIRKSPVQRLLAPTRSISQLGTSFIST